ncbi:App1 family protein [Flexithrix dorotheae]|uniref:App1 family protein n=1 Tax=Flexithrix dorotheae TaxID=70993 RepID=UPI00146EA544|nr:phosphatase domain-containing protein [Flexithrix dorotheae]
MKKVLGWREKPVIQPYRGIGSDTSINLKGRVLENSGLSSPQEENSKWKNFKAMIKRYLSDGLPGLPVEARHGNKKKVVCSDQNGFFEVNFKNESAFGENGPNWGEIELKLLDTVDEQTPDSMVKGEYLVVNNKLQYGVISDVDDTFLISYSTKFLKKIRLLLFKNAHTRVPFKGVAAFYRALRRGKDGRQKNPIFYVSSSEWNLYDLLVDFCHFHNIPKGPFMLRNIPKNPLKIWKSGRGNHNHKFDKIVRLLELYPELKFILIGDTGQKDAEIYGSVAMEYPEQILGIYLREVNKGKNSVMINNIKETIAAKGVEMILVSDSDEAAKHAYEKGWIHANALPAIYLEKEKDRQTPSDMQQLFGEYPFSQN